MIGSCTWRAGSGRTGAPHQWSGVFGTQSILVPSVDRGQEYFEGLLKKKNKSDNWIVFPSAKSLIFDINITLQSLQATKLIGAMMAYTKLKKLAVDVIDDFTDLDILAHYGDTYNAKTLLDNIQITAPVRSVMSPRVNKVFAKANGSTWKGIRPVDSVKCKTIGDFIKLVAKNAQETVPAGEPQ